MSDQEQEAKKESKEKVRDQVRDGIFRRVASMFEASDLGTPGDEHRKNLENVLAALPEGTARQVAEKIKPMAEVGTKVADGVDRVKTAVWKVAKRILIGEAPWVLAIPDTLPSNIDAWGARQGGKVMQKGVEAGVGAVQKGVEVGKGVLSWGIGMADRIKNSSERQASSAAA